MMQQQVPVKKYKLKPMTEEVRRKVERSYAESLDLVERELHCPSCGRYLVTLYSDASGHFKSKCPTCKTVSVINMAYFRRAKRSRRLHIHPFTAE